MGELILARPVLGVDPGIEGSTSVLNAVGVPIFVSPFRNDMTEAAAVNMVQLAVDALRREGGNICYFEKVGYIGKRDGKKGDGAKGAFTFGLVNGLVRGAIRALKVEVHLVPPMLWQSRMQCLTGGNKNVSKNRAQELFPEIKMTHAIADGLLIARYGWEMERL